MRKLLEMDVDDNYDEALFFGKDMPHLYRIRTCLSLYKLLGATRDSLQSIGRHSSSKTTELYHGDAAQLLCTVQEGRQFIEKLCSLPSQAIETLSRSWPLIKTNFAPPSIEHVDDVKADNLQKFLEVSSRITSELDSLSIRIALRLLAEICKIEYGKKKVKARRQIPRIKKQSIILEEIRSSSVLGTKIAVWTDGQIMTFFEKNLGDKTSYTLANMKKKNDSLKKNYDRFKDTVSSQTLELTEELTTSGISPLLSEEFSQIHQSAPDYEEEESSVHEVAMIDELRILNSSKICADIICHETTILENGMFCEDCIISGGLQNLIADSPQRAAFSGTPHGGKTPCHICDASDLSLHLALAGKKKRSHPVGDRVGDRVNLFNGKGISISPYRHMWPDFLRFSSDCTIGTWKDTPRQEVEIVEAASRSRETQCTNSIPLSVSGAGCMCGYYAVFGALGEIPLDQAISPNNETQYWVKSRQKVHQYSRLSEDMSLIDEVEERVRSG
ncbi:hypothetical protein ADUPG1_013913 [Aduncisulcus paluster]|uniref:Uncharacterized protein n=1 Tax=Aduncisulcus paluster TaxID=2918883 RepID=A0ABQ5K4T0_9EUKA|nr:hypothetical protein ADUPG1_013913 [Aduncisulcus paluster]